MSSLLGDITVPGRPEVHVVSAGIYAYGRPDGTWRIVVAYNGGAPLTCLA